LCKIEVLLISRQAVADDQSGVRASSRWLINQTIDKYAMAGHVQDRHSRWMSGIGWRIAIHGGGN
jgi:hypothetical protein